MNRIMHRVSRASVLVPALVLAGLALAPGGAKQAGPAWRTDLGAAIREAHVERKDLLIEFTLRGASAGEGGAPPVDRLVYDTEKFLRAAGQRFVPVRLTVATDGSAGPGGVDVVTLAEKYAITRVPSLVLTDLGSRPYAVVESDSESVEAQLALLEAAAARRAGRDDAMAKADASTGADRAGHLHQALEQVGRFALSDYEGVVAEVVALDPDNALKLKEQYAPGLAERRVDRAIQARVYPLVDRADFAAAMTAIDEVLATEKPPAAQAQLLVAFKAELLLSLGRRDEARRVFGQALTLSGDPAATEKVKRAMQRLDE